MACIWKTKARKVSSGHDLGHQGSCSCVGAGCPHHSDVAENGGHPTGHVSFRDKNSASTCAMPGSATAQRGAFARCCWQSGRIVQPRFGRAYVDPPPQQRSRPHHAIATAYSLCAPPRPRHRSAVCAQRYAAVRCVNPGTGRPSSTTCAAVSSRCRQGGGGRVPPAPRFHALRQQDACRDINVRSHGQGGRDSVEPPQTQPRNSSCRATKNSERSPPDSQGLLTLNSTKTEYRKRGARLAPPSVVGKDTNSAAYARYTLPLYFSRAYSQEPLVALLPIAASDHLIYLTCHDPNKTRCAEIKQHYSSSKTLTSSSSMRLFLFASTLAVFSATIITDGEPPRCSSMHWAIHSVFS